MTEACAILDAIRATIVEAAQERHLAREDGEAIAQRVETMLRRDFGPDKHYIPGEGRINDRQMALDLLGQGSDPEAVARKVGVHVSTVYRWRSGQVRRKRSPGLGSDEWVL